MFQSGDGRWMVPLTSWVWLLAFWCGHKHPAGYIFFFPQFVSPEVEKSFLDSILFSRLQYMHTSTFRSISKLVLNHNCVSYPEFGNTGIQVCSLVHISESIPHNLFYMKNRYAKWCLQVNFGRFGYWIVSCAEFWSIESTSCGGCGRSDTECKREGGDWCVSADQPSDDDARPRAPTNHIQPWPSQQAIYSSEWDFQIIAFYSLIHWYLRVIWSSSRHWSMGLIVTTTQ